MKALRIIFMGTPEFALPSLEIMAEHKFNIVAVITAPDKPQGRGQKLVASPVKQCAEKLGIRVLQPTHLKSHEFIEELRSCNANLQVVVAFRMLPEVVWAMPAHGTFNLHGSLLPQYRGAAPINWAIINGEKETGVTTFFLQHDIDTGSIIFQERELILDEDDVGTLYQRLMKKGADLVLQTVRAIETGEYPSLPQPTGVEIRHAPKIFKETCEVNWDKPSNEIRNFVRGLSPYPGAWTVFQGKTYKIFRVHEVVLSHSCKALPVGSIDTDNKTYLYARTKDGLISIQEWQPEGKKRMTIADFFRGNKL
ncbi:MAG: methionyl-tRNA formyltransferase [Cyclobacteriaceae bacterium]|nr:methionyl-tRNA formyltransferase [Cyclobacteriaceae bacterium]